MDPILNQFHCVRSRPIPKEPLNFYQFKQGNRLFLTITDTTSVWKDDLAIGERLFADTVICTPKSVQSVHVEEVARVQDILKQRMKYPGAREDPAIESIAKTWVLPSKLHMGPSVEMFLDMSEDAVQSALSPLLTQLNIQDCVIHFLKLELSSGAERQLLYKIVDSGFRPSLVLVKWSHDLDDHIPTAYCAGHLMNSGYSLVSLENGYALYMYLDHSLYDTCSMKTVALENPFIDSISQSVLEALKVPQVKSDISTIQEVVQETN